MRTMRNDNEVVLANQAYNNWYNEPTDTLAFTSQTAYEVVHVWVISLDRGMVYEYRKTRLPPTIVQRDRN